MSYVIKWRSDREYLSSLHLKRKGPTFWWADAPAKALLFEERQLAETLCGLINSYKPTRGHAVVEVDL